MLVCSILWYLRIKPCNCLSLRFWDIKIWLTILLKIRCLDGVVCIQSYWSYWYDIIFKWVLEHKYKAIKDIVCSSGKKYYNTIWSVCQIVLSHACLNKGNKSYVPCKVRLLWLVGSKKYFTDAVNYYPNEYSGRSGTMHGYICVYILYIVVCAWAACVLLVSDY